MHLARHIDTAILEAMAADVCRQLDEHDQALVHARTALGALGDARTKASALALAQCACAAAQAGDLDIVKGCTYAAADLADILESTQTRRYLRLLRTLIRPYHATTLGEQLAQRLDALPQ